MSDGYLDELFSNSKRFELYIKLFPQGDIPIPHGELYNSIYVVFLISTYHRKARRYEIIHNILQLITLIGAAVVALLLSLEIPKYFSALLSGCVTIAAIIDKYYKFGERTRELDLAAAEMSQEHRWFLQNQGPYKFIESKAEKSYVYVQNIDNIVNRALRKPMESESKQESNNKQTK